MPVVTKGSWKGRKRNSSDDPEEFRATLGEHLEELRDRIIRILFLLTAGWVVGWFLFDPVYTHLDQLVNASIRQSLPRDIEYKPVLLNATDAFMLRLKISFVIGLAISVPFVVLQLWGFIAPGLRPDERKPFRYMAPLSVLLFALGAFFCWLILPAAFKWFAGFVAGFEGAALHQEVGKLVTFVLKMMVAFGLGFQLPLVVFTLGKLGIIGPDTMIAYWRQATVIIFFSSAILTPSQDIFSMLMMALPMTILFSISVYAVKITGRSSKHHPPELNDLD